jgi:CSLREA domain-containing protein
MLVLRWLVIAVGALAGATDAQAATFTVTSGADTGGIACGASCTLRQAIGAANAAAGADTITFNAEYTITPPAR